MKHQLYFPPRLADQLKWLQHFRQTLPGCLQQMAVVQPLPEDFVAEVMRDLDWLIYVMGPAMKQARAQSRALTAVQRALLMGDARAGNPVTMPALSLPEPPAGPPARAGALKRVFRLVAMLKCHTVYNEGIGRMLGVVGSHFERDSAVPLFQLRVAPGARGMEVRGRVKRYGHQGVWIETRRGGGDWERLGAGAHFKARFVDDRPLLTPGVPEVREYRLCFYDRDARSGDWSPVAAVAVPP